MSTLTPYRSTARPGRSISNASTATYRTGTSSRSVSPPRSIRALRQVPAPAVQPFFASSLDGMLCQMRSNSSMASLTSLSLQSVRSETRPEAFGPLEEREERAQFGDLLELLEPRNSVGFWGVREILECESLDAKIIA